MAITSNTVYGSEKKFNGRVDWLVIAQSADATGNETLKAASTGKYHYIEKIRVDMCPGTTAASFTINSDTTAKIGPVDLIDTGTTFFEYEFLRPLQFGVGEAINLDTESADQIHAIVEGFTAEN